MWLTFKMVKTYCRGSRSRRDVTVDVSTSVHVPSPAAVVLQTSNKPANVNPPGSSPFAEAPSASASVPHASAGDQTAPRRSSSPAMGSVPTEQSREHCAVAWLHGLDSGVQCLRARSSGRARNESRVVLFRPLFFLSLDLQGVKRLCLWHYFVLFYLKGYSIICEYIIREDRIGCTIETKVAIRIVNCFIILAHRETCSSI